MRNRETQEAMGLESFFAETIETYLNRSSNNSINRLAGDTAVNRRTLNKIRMKDSDLTLIDKMKLIKLIEIGRGCASPAEAFEMLSNTVGYIDSSYKALRDAFSEKKFRIASDIESLIQTEDEFALFILAANKNGTTLFQIGSVLGSNGEEALSSLTGKGVLKLDGVKVDLNLDSDKDFSIVPRETIKKYFGLFARMYKISHSGKKRNYIAYNAQNINREALGKIYNLLEDAHCEINKILADSNSLGDLPFYMGIVMDTFTRESEQTLNTNGGSNEIH